MQLERPASDGDSLAVHPLLRLQLLSFLRHIHQSAAACSLPYVLVRVVDAGRSAEVNSLIDGVPIPGPAELSAQRATLCTLRQWMIEIFLPERKRVDRHLLDVSMLPLLLRVLESLRVMIAAGLVNPMQEEIEGDNTRSDARNMRDLVSIISNWLLASETLGDVDVTEGKAALRLRYDVQVEACRILFLLQEMELNRRIGMLWERFITALPDFAAAAEAASQGAVSTVIALTGEEIDDMFRSQLQGLYGRDERTVKELLKSGDFDVSHYALRLLLGLWTQTSSTLETLNSIMMLETGRGSDAQPWSEHVRELYQYIAALASNALANKSEDAKPGVVYQGPDKLLRSALMNLLKFMIGYHESRSEKVEEKIEILRSKPAIRARQDLLRSLGVPDQLFQLLHAASPVKHSGILRLLYAVLLKVAENNEDNRVLFQRHIDVLLAHLGTKLGGSRLMEELLKSPSFIGTLVAERRLQDLLHLVARRGHHASYIKLLTRLCVVNDQPAHKHQMLMLAHVQENTRQLFPDSVTTEYAFALNLAGASGWTQQLLDAAAQGDEALHTEVRYHMSVVELLAAVCVGPNRDAQLIVRNLRRDFALDVVLERASTLAPNLLPPGVQRIYWELLQRLYAQGDMRQLSEGDRKSLGSLLQIFSTNMGLVSDMLDSSASLGGEISAALHAALQVQFSVAVLADIMDSAEAALVSIRSERVDVKSLLQLTR